MLVACSQSAPITAPRNESRDINKVDKKVRLFGALENVKLGMTVDELQRAVPDIAFHAGRGVWQLERSDAVYKVDLDKSERVREVRVSVRGRTLKELENEWGPARPPGSGFYFDATSGLAAIVAVPDANPDGETLRLEFTAYVPLEQLLDADPTYLAGVKVLGRPVDQVTRELGTQFQVDDSMTNPQGDATLRSRAPTEYSQERAHLWLDTSKGVVTSWVLLPGVWVDDEIVLQEIMPLLTKLWGAKPEVSETHVTFRRSPYVVVRPKKLEISVSIEAPAP